MKWWMGLLPYLIVRMLSVKLCERFNHSGMSYHQSVGKDFICFREAQDAQ